MDYVDKRLQEEAVKLHDAQRHDFSLTPVKSRLLTFPPSSGGFFTPLNIIFLLVLGYTTYVLLRPTPPPKLPKEPPAIVFRVFTPRTLLPFDGEDGKPVYLAVRGRVFDVTPGRNFYGPGGPYSNFAGRDASRGLAHGSFDEDMLTEDLDGPLDPLEGLGPDEVEALVGWEESFLSKYLVVGKLVAVGEEEKK
ncbi:membrane-associated progesterone receptor component 1 [Colletotrichum tabaci]|uniref:Membrane-associated progesterone receptor component 1 n=1 Tax=Colletotrichum tabaci TaxID=1209068 RepID=A0AAV9TWP5_9PEZI